SAVAFSAASELTEFVHNPDNLWAVDQAMIRGLVRWILPDEPKVCTAASSALWKLAEYMDFVEGILSAGALPRIALVLQSLGREKLQDRSLLRLQTVTVGLMSRLSFSREIPAKHQVLIGKALLGVMTRPSDKSTTGTTGGSGQEDGSAIALAHTALDYVLTVNELVSIRIATGKDWHALVGSLAVGKVSNMTLACCVRYLCHIALRPAIKLVKLEDQLTALDRLAAITSKYLRSDILLSPEHPAHLLAPQILACSVGAMWGCIASIEEPEQAPHVMRAPRATSNVTDEFNNEFEEEAPTALSCEAVMLKCRDVLIDLLNGGAGAHLPAPVLEAAGASLCFLNCHVPLMHSPAVLKLLNPARDVTTRMAALNCLCNLSAREYTRLRVKALASSSCSGWVRFCSSLLAGRGAYLLLNCAMGMDSLGNKTDLRVTAAQTLAFTAMVAAPHVLKDVAVALDAMLRCRVNATITASAALAVWSLSQEPSNREYFSSIGTAAQVIHATRWCQEQ
ncbi:unnamed protein product, partial [Chrysoparadoxa australica]